MDEVIQTTGSKGLHSIWLRNSENIKDTECRIKGQQYLFSVKKASLVLSIPELLSTYRYPLAYSVLIPYCVLVCVHQLGVYNTRIPGTGTCLVNW